MKSAFEKKLNYIAAGIFLIGLIVNVSLSLTDPFIFVDTDILSRVSGSSDSGSSSSSSGGGGQYDGDCLYCSKWVDGGLAVGVRITCRSGVNICTSTPCTNGHCI